LNDKKLLGSIRNYRGYYLPQYFRVSMDDFVPCHLSNLGHVSNWG